MSIDDSDDPEGLVRHLPRRLLKAGAQKRTKKRSAVGNRLEAASSDEDDDDDGDAREVGNWSRKKLGTVGSKVPEFVKPVPSGEELEKLELLKTASAYEFYKEFQPDSFAEEIVYQSRLYAVQKDKKQALDTMSLDSYR